FLFILLPCLFPSPRPPTLVPFMSLFRSVCPVKPFPDVGQIFFGNADAVIFYGAGDKSVLPETGDENVSAFSSIINSIGNQIDKQDRKSTRLNSSHGSNSYAIFCLKKSKL